MTLFLTVLHVMVCVFLVVVVLLQRGKGAEIGAVFGGGSNATIFGSRGAGNFLTKLTTGAAVVFMLTSLSLAYFAQEGARSTLLDDDSGKQTEQPAAPFSDAAKPEAESKPAADGGFQEVPSGDAQQSAPAPTDPGPAPQTAPKTPPAEQPSSR